VTSGLDADGAQEVTFLEWAKPQRVPRDLCLALVEDDDGAALVDGVCRTCGRDSLPLTFHHLIPKQVHAKYLGHPPPRPYAAERAATGPCAKLELGSHGILVCRPCHSAIHRIAPNAVLAERYSTLDALLRHDDFARWVAYVEKKK